MTRDQILAQLVALTETVHNIGTKMDALAKRYEPPIKTCETLKYSPSLPHELISVFPPISIPLAQNEIKEYVEESDNDHVEVLIYEPNPDDFDLLDDDIDVQIGRELIDNVLSIVTPLEEVVVNTEPICKVITDSDSCILASTTACLGFNFALHSCHVSLDFVLPPTKPLPQVDPVLLVLFHSLQDIASKIYFFYSGRLGGDTRFLPPLTRVYELWEKLAHPLCSWPGD